MDTMQEIFRLTFDFLKSTELDIFGFKVTLFTIMLTGLAIEIAIWILDSWRGENNAGH